MFLFLFNVFLITKVAKQHFYFLSLIYQTNKMTNTNDTKKIDTIFTFVIIGIVALCFLELYRLTHLN